MAEQNPQREQERTGPVTGTISSRPMCKCCKPPKPLVLRPDFGLMADGSAKYAICVARRPVVVHVNRGDGVYEKRDDLSLSDDGNKIMGPDGPVATSTRATQRGIGERVGGATPSTMAGERIDLSRDRHF